MRPALLLLPVLLLVSCATKPTTTFAPTDAQSRMIELIDERLQLAREVAWQKYQDDLPVLDRKREAALLATLVERGRATGVPDAEVANFFTAQLAASRKFQAFLIAKWKRGGRLPSLAPRRIVPDLRNEIDAISGEMLRLLPTIAPSDAFASHALSALRANGLPNSVARTAAAALREAPAFAVAPAPAPQLASERARQ